MRKTLYYVFDPLCGWCYGASGTVSAAASADIDLRLLPSGLFSVEKGLAEPGARLHRPDAALRMANDARVAEARALLQAFDARGVPSFIVERNGRRHLLQASTASSDPQAFLDQFAAA
ncbi:hypothetical protein [Thiomonas sp. FB-6]|uniref:hypothetical protein n=1 Tax=Thiomonas sp. FB-6 TaxID=1158291 RepID=UPI0003722FB1|nr:hypothetical protein [Thiomonas sp. FB-6]